MLRTAITRSAVLRPAVSASRTTTTTTSQLQPTRQAHAVSNPTLANIEKRWETMPPQEQAELWMALRDRMKVDWKQLTAQEKKAGEFRLCCVVWCCQGRALPSRLGA